MRFRLNTIKFLMLAVSIGALVLIGGATRSTANPQLQGFQATGASQIDWTACYDTNPANTPVATAGHAACNPANLTTLPKNTAVTTWSITTIPIGNRVSSAITTFTPSNGTAEWQQASIACAPVIADECSSAAATGNDSYRFVIACNGLTSMLGAGGAGGPVGNWPDNALWVPASFTRIGDASAGANVSAGPNAGIHQLLPFPASGVAGWTFKMQDVAPSTFLYLGGSSIFALPLKAQHLTYQSPFGGQAGLRAEVVLRDTYRQPYADSPPTDDTIECRDTPAESVDEDAGWVTPDADRVIPRWTIFTSAPDLGNAAVDRILDWQCDVIGAGQPDADSDCDPDASDTNGANKDIDGDLVPDGVERANGSDPTVADTDGDGADDYAEIFQFTNPAAADTDGDGQADRQDDRPTVLAEGSDAADLTDDNCPNVANASQLNTDSLYQYHGMGAGTGDRTNPDEDMQGDACDLDDDNDDMLDIAEATMQIRSWSGNIDDSSNGDPEGEADGTSLCVGPGIAGTFAPIRVMSPVMGDVDKDYVLDGVECRLRSRPDASIRPTEAQNCNSGAVTVITGLLGGCAQPAGANATCTPVGSSSDPSPRCDSSSNSDPDADSLYMPFSSALHVSIEVFYRTRLIAISTGVMVNDIDGDGLFGDADNDSDRDLLGLVGTTPGLRDGIEVRYYGTSPATDDTDQDGCPDAEEVFDINGDGVTSSGDQAMLAAAFGGHDTSPADGQIDAARYAMAANRDFSKDGTTNAGDMGLLASAIATIASCEPFAGAGLGEDNIDIGSATKGLP